MPCFCLIRGIHDCPPPYRQIHRTPVLLYQEQAVRPEHDLRLYAGCTCPLAPPFTFGMLP